MILTFNFLKKNNLWLVFFNKKISRALTLTLIELMFQEQTFILIYTENDVPQPHVDVAFGLVILK